MLSARCKGAEPTPAGIRPGQNRHEVSIYLLVASTKQHTPLHFYSCCLQISCVFEIIAYILCWLSAFSHGKSSESALTVYMYTRAGAEIDPALGRIRVRVSHGYYTGIVFKYVGRYCKLRRDSVTTDGSRCC